MNVFLKLFLRTFILPVVTFLRIDNFIAKRSKNQNIILCLHGVTKHPNFSINNRHMPVEQFEKLIRCISKKYEVVSLTEMFENSSKPQTKKRICLTFDDGYLNNLTTALPILEKYKIPASFYIITQGLNDRNFIVWPDQISFILNKISVDSFTFNGKKFEKKTTEFSCDEIGGMNIIDYIKTLGDEKYHLIEELSKTIPGIENAYKQSPDYWKLLDSETLLEFSNSPFVSIGSHTNKHHNLAYTDQLNSHEELSVSKNILENLLNRPIDSIAYPDGSYMDSTKEIAENIGYKYQLAVNYREASDPSDPRILARLSVSNSTTYQSVLLQIALNFKKVGF